MQYELCFVYSSPSNFLLIRRVATVILELCFPCSFSSNFLYIFISRFIQKSLLQYLAKELCFLCSFSSNFQHSFISLYWNLVWFFCNIQPVNFVGFFCWIFLLFDFFFVQIAIIILSVCGQVCPNYPNCKLIVWFWWGWSSIPKVPKIASLQCFLNISKKR